VPVAQPASAAVGAPDSCSTGAMLDIRHFESVALFDRPGGRPLHEIHNDSIAGRYYEFAVLASANGWLRVAATADEPVEERMGWIPTTHVTVFARNYVDTLRLLTEPRADAPVRDEVREWSPEPYAVLACRGTWLHVRTTIDGATHEGWMPKQMQCANAYTTCN
jgi:hypothetical protein